MSDRLVELQERLCELAADIIGEIEFMEVGEAASILHCSKRDVKTLKEWGIVFGQSAYGIMHNPDYGLEPAHSVLHLDLRWLRAILECPFPPEALEWALSEDGASSKRIKKKFGVPMTTAPKPSTVKAKTEKRGDGVYRITVPMDVELPTEVEVRYKEE